jgi:hypothetical protein
LRFVSSTACSAFAALALAACGGSETERSQPAELPAEVGGLLASETREVTAALERGDPATAHMEAVELHGATLEAIRSGRVPKSLRAPLLAAVERLVASIEVPAAPPAPAPPPADEEQEEEGADDEDDEGGKGDKKGKKAKKGEGKDKGGDGR